MKYEVFTNTIKNYNIMSKKLFTVLVPIAIGVLLTASVFAQSPQKMSYQAVIRNSSDDLITNTQVGMKISILQGSETGTAVYTETQTPNTNANGLVSIEIGGGTALSSIDWSTGNYYIKTEIDPTGGTSYSISGTSQLLSVPYALYAENSNGLPTGTLGQTLRHDGSAWVSNSLIRNNGTNVGVNSNPLSETKLYVHRPQNDFGPNYAGIYSYRYGDAGATSGGTSWNLGGVDAAIKGNSYYGNNYTAGVAGYNYLDYDKSAGVIGSSSNANVFGALAYKESSSLTWAGYFNGNAKIIGTLSITGGSPGAGKVLTSDANGNATWTAPNTPPVHYVGETYGGGIVFYVYDNGQHGLIAATTDQSVSVAWNAGTNMYTMALANGIGAGKSNTDLIIARQSIGNFSNYAARACHEYSGGGFGDWYLPSIYELNLLYMYHDIYGGFANAYYWSSTESFTDASNFVWDQDFSNGSQSNTGKAISRRVRAIRAF
ncbi:MAG: DUF1566 domain-containing protein [Bacteroidales bacterium]|nr:DUF1566 domain-containing protein [Bacteroidales bacterium]